MQTQGERLQTTFLVLARASGVSPTVRMPVMMWAPATSSSTIPAAPRIHRCGLLADSRHPRSATEQTSQPTL